MPYRLYTSYHIHSHKNIGIRKLIKTGVGGRTVHIILIIFLSCMVWHVHFEEPCAYKMIKKKE